MSVYVSSHHYTNMKSIFTQHFLGSSFLPPALGVMGQGRLNINDKFPPKKIWAKPKQAGKKEGGLGEGIFARLPRLGVGKRFRNSCVSRKAKQKNFRFLN